MQNTVTSADADLFGEMTMSDLIDRKKAIEALDFEIVHMTAYCNGTDYGNLFAKYNKGLEDGIKALKALPSADPERKKGEWIFHIDDLFPEESTQECSVCHEEESIKIQNDNFCPNCGADMRGKRD